MDSGEYVESTGGRLRFCYLPGYSPELNPDETVWSYVKHHVAGKKIISGPEQFLKVVKEALYLLMHRPSIVSAFFIKPSLQYIVCFAVILAFAGSILNAQEGYTGPRVTVTVKTAKSRKDDYPVILHGKIEQYLGDEKHLFTDAAGSIVVEIDNRLWRGISVDENDTVQITGEIDRGFTSVETDVSSSAKI
ncbi:MAG: NirD/YgiW/YdeI family stress tolerance protein [Treponema sp.]|jgi:uncharacterized protein (TIGR00156 family)|nr:NirD/YgiW/YdeI family stress tolerance protein [Treponema sp.]